MTLWGMRLCVNPLICHSRESGERSDRKVNPWTELSAKWFAQRHEGIKKLLRVFVSSCELKTRHTPKYRAMGSRFRGNDNVGTLGRGNRHFRDPELVCALHAFGSSMTLGGMRLLITVVPIDHRPPPPAPTTVTLNLVQGPFLVSTLRSMWHDGC
jgi:hypothetical protein